VDDIRAAQLLTVHGAADETIPVCDAHMFAERLAGRHRLHIMEGASHFFTQDGEVGGP
jgi:pimeloyl-ACP methyl ester carboxylesterase